MTTEPPAPAPVHSPKPDRESEWEEQELNPVGPDFWIGQILVGVGVAVGIWLAARAGFAEAVRFTKHENARQARSTLRALRLELEVNLREIRAAREHLRENQPATLQLRTTYVDAASGRPYMAIVDPRLIPEILKVLRYPLSEAAERLRTPRGFERREQEQIAATLDEVLEQAEKYVLPLLRTEEERLDSLLASLGGRP